MKRGITILLLVAFMVLGAFSLSRFLNDNSDPMRLRFFYWQTKEVSLGVLVLISFLVGFLISSAFLMGSMLSKSMEARRLRRENAAFQKLMESKPAGNGEPSSQDLSSHSRASN